MFATTHGRPPTLAFPSPQTPHGIVTQTPSNGPRLSRAQMCEAWTRIRAVSCHTSTPSEPSRHSPPSTPPRSMTTKRVQFSTATTHQCGHTYASLGGSWQRAPQTANSYQTPYSTKGTTARRESEEEQHNIWGPTPVKGEEGAHELWGPTKNSDGMLGEVATAALFGPTGRPGRSNMNIKRAATYGGEDTSPAQDDFA